MTRWHKMIRCMFLALVAVLALAGGALAQESVQYTWTAPTTGSPVEYYVVEHSVDGGAFVEIAQSPSTNYTLVAEYEKQHMIRVQGVDAYGRKGVYSETSEPYTPTLGAPGQPGKPIALF